MYSEKYAKVIVKNNSRYTDNLFTYKVPEFLVDDLQIGHRVLVPFGKGNKPIEAYVFLITEKVEDTSEVHAFILPLIKLSSISLPVCPLNLVNVSGSLSESK